MKLKRNSIRISKKCKPNKNQPSPLLGLTFSVVIEKMAIGGAGVARLTENSIHSNKDLNTENKNKYVGLVVFVRSAVPGDHLEISITAFHKNYAEAVISKIIEPSPQRRKPPCLHAALCGGCSWQQILPEEQLKQKKLLLLEAFRKFAPIIAFHNLPDFNVIPSPLDFAYRNRVQPKYQNFQLGFFSHTSHQIVNVSECLLIETPIQKKWEEIRLWCENRFKDQDLHRLAVSLKENGDVFWEELGGLSDRSALSFSQEFSQVNRFQNKELIQTVLEWTESLDVKTSKKNKVEMIYDFYCGAGNFTIPLAEHNKNLAVTGVELSEGLIENGKKAVLEGLKNLSFYCSDVELYLRKHTLKKNSLIVLDPPRGGANTNIMSDLARAQPQKLIYISCHPVSLARDLNVFIQESKYKINRIQCFEMFPQTDHMETIVELIC